MNQRKTRITLRIAWQGNSFVAVVFRLLIYLINPSKVKSNFVEIL